MKKMLLSAVLLGTGLSLFASAAGEARLMKMIPADASAAAFLNYDAWKNAPAVLALNRKESRSLNDIDSAAVWYRDDGLFVVLAVMKKPLDLPQIQKVIEESAASHEVAKEFKLQLTPAKFGKNPAWNAVACGPQAISKPFSFFMVSLPGNLLLFTENARAAEQALLAAEQSTGFKLPKGLKGALRASCKMKTPIAGIPPQMMASLDITGAKKNNLKGFVKAVCSNAEEAAQLMMQTGMLIQFGINSWFVNDYQLGSELFRALRFANDKKTVTLDFNLSQELLEKLAAYSEKQAKIVAAEQEQKKALPASGKTEN